MKNETKKTLGHILILLGLIIIGFGIYYLGYHNGMERLRTGDSGLGGFAEWAGSLILIVFGIIVTGIGALIQNKSA